MADDKTIVGGQDRSRIAANEPYEVSYFAQRFGALGGHRLGTCMSASRD
jgi:Protein of unknown function (DUF3606)